jgi:hypothetical protein
MTTQPNSSVRRILGVAVTLMVVMPGIALAQSPDRPIVELGAQVSKKASDSGLVGQALRLTVPLKRLTAIEVTADVQTSAVVVAPFQRETSEREFSVHWRQTVFASGRLQIFGVLGGGRNRVETNDERIVQGRVELVDRSVVSEFVAHFGPAVQVELAPWLALRGDLHGIIGQRDSGVRGMVGAVIPIRRSRGGDPPSAPAPATIPDAKPKPAGSKFPPANWRRLKPGREVWVTTNTGSLVHGDIVAISDSSLTILEQGREVTIRLDDVRWVEGRDGLRNGFLIGAVPGAVAGGVSAYSVASGICGSCDINGSAWILPGAVAGGIVGGLLGMMVDGLIPGRQTLFWGNTTVVMPVITPSKKAIDVAIRWR